MVYHKTINHFNRFIGLFNLVGFQSCDFDVVDGIERLYISNWFNILIRSWLQWLTQIKVIFVIGLCTPKIDCKRQKIIYSVILLCWYQTLWHIHINTRILKKQNTLCMYVWMRRCLPVLWWSITTVLQCICCFRLRIADKEQ